MSNTRITRRRFLGSAAAMGGFATLMPSRVPQVRASTQANTMLNVASVGVGGIGRRDRREIVGSERVRIVALCDVDVDNLRRAADDHADARRFGDWREMLDRLGNRIDAVCISTPDHTHAPIAMSAIRMGKHVYCQKPLSHSVHEARQLTLAAREQGAVTQMGIQMHSRSGYRMAVAMLQAGVIGKVNRVHSWSIKEWGYDGPMPTGSTPPPPTLRWDNWLGPAPARPYAPDHYHPRQWRCWYDFGAGTIGDMGIHILDPVVTALQLGAPLRILSESPPPLEQTFSMKNRVHYTFAATAYTDGELKVTWHDGKDRPDTTDWPLPPGRELPDEGTMFLGEQGAMLLPHVGAPALLPRERFRGAERMRLGDVNHYHQWVNACLGDDEVTTPFDYSGPLTETLLLGSLACRFPTQVLEWDTQALRFTNFDEANALVRRTYRQGWQVPGLS